MSGGGGGGVGLKVVTLDAVYTDTLVLDDRRTVTPRAVKDADVIKFTQRVTGIVLYNYGLASGKGGKCLASFVIESITNIGMMRLGMSYAHTPGCRRSLQD